MSRRRLPVAQGWPPVAERLDMLVMYRGYAKSTCT
jgi:hypothetical protein